MGISRTNYLPAILVLVLWFAGLGTAAQFAKISVMFPFLREIYPNTEAQLGLLISLIGFVGIGFGFSAGLIAAQYGFKKLLIAAILLGAVVSIYQASMPTMMLFMISRLIEGVSHLVIVVIAPTLIAQSSLDKYRGFAMSLWSTFFGVAFAITAWIGIPFVLSFGLAQFFVAHGLFMVLVAAILYFLIPEKYSNPISVANHQKPKFVEEHIRAYRSPFVSAPAIGWLFFTFTYLALLTILPDYVSPGERTFVTGAMPFVSIVTSLLCGWLLLPKFSPIRVIIFSFFAATGVAAIMLIFEPMGWASILIFAILGLVQSATFAAIPQLNKDAATQARASGALSQMGNLGNTLGTPILLAIAVSYGVNALMVSVIVSFLIGAVVHYILAKRRNIT